MGWEVILAIFGSVLGIAGGVGMVVGQLRRGVVEELRAALASAKDEIDIERGRSDRLDAECERLRTEVVALRVEVEALRKVRIDEIGLATRLAALLGKPGG